MSNYLSPFEKWQTERYGNFYSEQEPKEVEDSYEPVKNAGNIPTEFLPEKD